MIRGLWRWIESVIGGPRGRAVTVSMIVAASILGVGILRIEYLHRFDDESVELRNRARDAVRAVDIVAGRFVDHVELLRRAMETRLGETEATNREITFEGDSPDIAAEGSIEASAIAARGEAIAFVAITPLVRTSASRLGSAARVRYISISGFSAVYPRREMSPERFTSDMPKSDPVARVAPEYNPGRQSRWGLSDGAERLLWISAPVYGPTGFLGAIVIETPAGSLLTQPAREAADGVDVVIATRDERVLADEGGDGATANPDVSVDPSGGRFRSDDTTLVVADATSVAPWMVVIRVPQTVMTERTLKRMGSLLVAVPTTIMLLAFMSRLLRVNRRLTARERELRAVTADLTRARDEARAADRAKAVFLANIGHELRTPLNAVIGFAELIPSLGADSKESVALNEYAAYIKDAGDHLLNVLNDVLDLARAEADRIELRDSRLDPAELVLRCGRMLARQAVADGVTLIHRSETGVPFILADEVRLRQIVINLLTNAVKFTPEGGRVETDVGRTAEGGVRIAVRDTGVGIAAADIPKALEPFGQVHNTLSRTRRGAGLGLALARRLVELHGGRLSIESEPGIGTTVRVDLPASRVAPPGAGGERGVSGFGIARAPAD